MKGLSFQIAYICFLSGDGLTADRFRVPNSRNEWLVCEESSPLFYSTLEIRFQNLQVWKREYQATKPIISATSLLRLNDHGCAPFYSYQS